MTQSKKRLMIINLAIPLIIGIFSAILVNRDFSVYNSLRRPALSPPFYVFPIVWSILYILMGISSYLISSKRTKENEIDVFTCYILYALSLLLNVIWMIVFFKFKKFAIALVVLLLIIIIIFSKIFAFSKISKTAALIQLPYLMWSIFAAYLNISIYAMN